MIEEVVPPLAPRSLASATVVETSTSDQDRPTTIDRARSVASKGTTTSCFDWLPDSLLDELRWVAHQEGRDMAEIVVTAIDEFLADHWVRESDL